MNVIAKSNNQSQQIQQNNKTESKQAQPENLTNETTTPASTPASKQGSNTAKVRTIQGSEIDTRYRVVEADSLITSNLENGGINPAYSQELQPRNRERDSSIEQISRIATSLDPELLGESRLASDGAPIIGNDLMVESGNGRTLAIRQAYKNGTAQNYRNWLMNNAQYFGLNPDDIANMNNPVLVRERLTDIDRAKFSREANESSIAQMSASEIALMDAHNLTFDILRSYDPNKKLEDNKEFLQDFASVIPQNERGNFYQQDGSISRAGIERARNALSALAYNDSGILNRLSEFTDDEIKNISSALVNAAPTLAIFENSQYLKHLSIRNDINNAVKTLAQIREEGLSLADYLAQIPMFDDDEDTIMMRNLLNFFDENKNSYKKIANGLINYARLAMQRGNENQNVLPGMEDSIQVLRSQAVNLANNDVTVNLESYNQTENLTAEQKLIRDEQAWSNLIDSFMSGKLSGQNNSTLFPVMTTPLVFNLLDADLLPIEIRLENIHKILQGKHELNAATLKQIPRALANPIMIFKSEHDTGKGRDSRVILTDLTEFDGENQRSIIAAITLNRVHDEKKHGDSRIHYEINELSTVYRKDTSSKQQLTPNQDVIDWINKKFKDGRPMNLLQYINREKAAEWIRSVENENKKSSEEVTASPGISPLVPGVLQNLDDSIPNENDLDNLQQLINELDNAVSFVVEKIKEFKADNPDANTMPYEFFTEEILPSIELFDEEYDYLFPRFWKLLICSYPLKVGFTANLTNLLSLMTILYLSLKKKLMMKNSLKNHRSL